MRRSICGLVEFAYRRRGREKDLCLACWAEFAFEGETETEK